MKFIADLHIHSKFSRATAKNLDLENLYIAAQLKGITVVGTGDFTHPSWFSELTTKLDPAEEGLFKLKDEIAEKCDQKVPLSCRGPVRFILETEISCIYKKDSKTRKNHNLVFMPNFESASAFNSKLDAIGNIKSDGRPILGLDAKALLEIVLETSSKAYLIPAHIWTPWFSLLGSKSGFDSIEACFEDLTQHIFAVETGLSSDPAMNWRVSNLDHLTLVSNSDAHSPLNLGREANLFNTELSYSKIFSAIQSGNPSRFLGTYEFYPEEGKYHLDGHRKCNISFRPEKSIAHKGTCPVCGKPLTLGVLYRVEELADRDAGEKPEKTHPFYSLIPLTEILSEIFQVGPKSKRVSQNYHKALESLGSEFKILHILSIEAIDKAGISLLSEAIDKMRRKKFHIYPGYDGEYGKIKIFEQGEREKLRGQKSLFVIPVSNLNKTKNNSKPQPRKSISNNIKTSAALGCCPQPETEAKIDDIFSDLNTEQLKAVTYGGGPLLIIAGPGTGKTRTITHRMAYLIQEKGIDPENILAVTFTNKAAQEMRNRLNLFVKSSKSFPFVATFHSLCFKILNDQILKNPGKNNADSISHLAPHNFTIIDESDRKFMIGEAIRSVREDGIRISIQPDVLPFIIVLIAPLFRCATCVLCYLIYSTPVVILKLSQKITILKDSLNPVLLVVIITRALSVGFSNRLHKSVCLVVYRSLNITITLVTTW